MANSTKIQVEVLAFGITKDILGASLVHLDLEEGANVADLKAYLMKLYPSMRDLKSLLIAVNSEYGDEDLILKESDDIALIPPVSGG